MFDAKRTINLAADYTRAVSAGVIGVSPFIAGPENFSKFLGVGLSLYATSLISQVLTGRSRFGNARDGSTIDNYETNLVSRDAIVALTSFFAIPSDIASSGLESLARLGSVENLACLSIPLALIFGSEYFSKSSLRTLESEILFGSPKSEYS